MAQVRSSNVVQQNEPRPLPRKSKMLQSTQDTDRNNGYMMRGENSEGAGDNFHLSQRSSECRYSSEEMVPVKCFDEIPITVTNKPFSQLVEEKLSDTPSAHTTPSQLSKPKKSFLRKGEGLAKFQPKQYSCPSAVTKCSVDDYKVQHTKENNVTRVKPFLRKGSGLKRFRLKPITVRKKTSHQSRNNSKQKGNNCIEHKKCKLSSDNASANTTAHVTTDLESEYAVQQVKVTHKAVDGYSSQVNGNESDQTSFGQLYEDKAQDEVEELRAFEMLEQQAANSSFSSNCSFVSRILQISTQSSFNMNRCGTEEVQPHANFIPVDPVQNTPSEVSTAVIKQCPEFLDPLQCTKEQISEVARKIGILQEELFKYSDNHLDAGNDKKMEQNNFSEVANYIQRISHLHKSVELKDCQESEAAEGTTKEKDCITSNILHGGRQEQIRILVDDFKEMKHCNSDTECSFLSETMCVRFTENPYTHLQKEQKSSHDAFESDICGNSECSSVDQKAYEIAGSNTKVIPQSNCKPSSYHFEGEHHNTNETHPHQPGDSEDLILLKSDLLDKRLTELDMEISIYSEEKLKLSALRKESEIIIQELLSEKETLKSLIAKERAAIKRDREEIAAEKLRLEQYKSQLLREKQLLEGLQQVTKLHQNIEEKEHQIRSERRRDQYLIKRLQRENSELKEEICKLKNSENLYKKSRLSVNGLKAGEKMKFTSAVPNPINGLKKRNVENSLEICDIVPKRCIPLAAHKNPTEVQHRKPLKGKREVSPVDTHNGDKKFFPNLARQGSNKGKVINAASHHMRDLGNDDADNALVIHEVVPRKPLPSAVEENSGFESTHKFCDNMVRRASEEGNVDVHPNQLGAEKCNARLIDTVPSKMKDHESEEFQESFDVCRNSAQHFVPSKTVEETPEDELHRAENAALTVPDNENTINSLLYKKPAGESYQFQTRNVYKSAAVEKTAPENENIADFNYTGTDSLQKHDFSHHVAQASNTSTGESSADINILDDHTFTATEIIPSKLHCAHKNTDPDLTSSDRITRVKTHTDGRKEIWYNNGCVCKVSSDRMTEKIIYYNGDVLERCLKSKTEKYYFCKSKIWCTTYSDKTQLVEFSNGQTELKKPDGTIKTNYINGAAQTVFPDGRVEWILNDGRQCIIEPNGEKTWNFPNGQREIHTKDHKRREYPDGTIKYVFPDGSMKTKYANGRVRVKDKYGKLVMDSDLQ